jgi:hypothetical protein
MSAFGIGGFAAGLSSGLKDARGLMLDREEAKKLQSERAARERKDERRERALELQGELDRWRAPGVKAAPGAKNVDALEVAPDGGQAIDPTAVPTGDQPRVAPTPAEPVQRSQDEIRRELDNLRSQAAMDGDVAAAAEYVRLGQMKALATVGRALDPSSNLTPQHQADLINRGAAWITGQGYNGVYVDKDGNLAHADLGPIDSPEKMLGVKAFIAELADPKKANEIATSLRDKWEVQAQEREKMGLLERRMQVEEGTLDLRWDELRQKADQFGIKLESDKDMFLKELEQKQKVIDAEINRMNFQNEEDRARAKYYMSEAALNDAERIALGQPPLWKDPTDAYKQSEALTGLIDAAYTEENDKFMGGNDPRSFWSEANSQLMGYDSPQALRTAFEAVANDVIMGGGDGTTAPIALQITKEIFKYAAGASATDSMNFSDPDDEGQRYIQTSDGKAWRVSDRVYEGVRSAVNIRVKEDDAREKAELIRISEQRRAEVDPNGGWIGASPETVPKYKEGPVADFLGRMIPEWWTGSPNPASRRQTAIKWAR